LGTAQHERAAVSPFGGVNADGDGNRKQLGAFFAPQKTGLCGAEELPRYSNSFRSLATQNHMLGYKKRRIRTRCLRNGFATLSGEQKPAPTVNNWAHFRLRFAPAI
jgi:hypothetical protein